MKKKQFSIEGASEGKSEHGLDRRRFLETGVWAAGSAIGLTLFGTGGRFVVGDAYKDKPTQWVNVGEVAALPVGKMQSTTYSVRRKDAWRTSEEKGILYVYSDDGVIFTALSAICTHLGCNVHWMPENNDFRCPCHDAHFSRSGEVLSGPPQRPLIQLETKVEAGQLMVLV
ncbi:MAG: ubiquinol-cytochrome c reductase iron-sulfur subunit [Caldilineaceae bacterium]